MCDLFIFVTCHYIRIMSADSSTPCCFHVYLSQGVSPSSQTWKGSPAKLTSVVDWLVDLCIDLYDPLRALPTDTPDRCSFPISLRRILSCISQDKQALITKGKPRGIAAFHQNKHHSAAEASEQAYLVLPSVNVKARRAVCASHTDTRTLAHAICTHWHTKSNSGVTAGLTPVSIMLLLKQTSQPESDLLRQAIPLSAPGTPRCLMPVGTTVPGLSAYDWGSDTLLVPPFASWIYNNTT